MTPTALAAAQIASTRTACTATVSANTPTSSRGAVAVRVDRLVDRAQRTLEPQPPQERHGPRERPARRREKSSTASTTVAATNAASIQMYAPTSYCPTASANPTAASVTVAAPPSARSSSTVPATGRVLPGMAARRLEDPDRVAADRRRQDLPGGVRGEVGPREPGEPVANALRRSSRCQRHAIGNTVTAMIVTESRNQPRLAFERMSHVCERSIFQTR